MDKKIIRKAGKKQPAPIPEDDEDDDEEEDEEDIPISDLEDLDDEDREDLIPHTRLTINNTNALLAALERIALPTDKKTPFSAHQSITSAAETSESIPDVSDDLARELAFYSQCLDAAQQGRAKLLAEGVPFSRPKDYFAEMVKEDAHMEKIKAKLVEEASSKKAAAEARKLRDLKKFGKQVQVAKLQERQKAKRETLEKIKTLKRSKHTFPPKSNSSLTTYTNLSSLERQEGGGGQSTNEGDIFDVAVDNEIKSNQRSGPSVNHKRTKKNEKYGFGGKKRLAKSGDAMSSGDLSGFNAKKMKAKSHRPGKGKRKAMASR